jgi:hypothetical protein
MYIKRILFGPVLSFLEISKEPYSALYECLYNAFWQTSTFLFTLTCLLYNALCRVISSGQYIIHLCEIAPTKKLFNILTVSAACKMKVRLQVRQSTTLPDVCYAMYFLVFDILGEGVTALRCTESKTVHAEAQPKRSHLHYVGLKRVSSLIIISDFAPLWI